MPNNNGQNNNENARAPVAQITRACSFEIPDYLLAAIWATMPIMCTRANEALQNNTQLLGPVEPPVWTDEEKAFLVLWISRERRIFGDGLDTFGGFTGLEESILENFQLLYDCT
ncbi:uncharacterized protein BJ212DRAFT_1483772 [Suillus subaureus]|uniref:Uncharacterized protein n=1 Tax=Suillus subaureus TaxID=48587 RepID=A0A9P7JAV0_9AGAM|nr:uncharacterized protein BJ212DRAFT_1483772 [Suillus subaureus]KAG1811522.1 hypothetical protein BJ212DRAFT_1483772 [Suillus subaureus]